VRVGSVIAARKAITLGHHGGEQTRAFAVFGFVLLIFLF
jgi:hypothetical protein